MPIKQPPAVELTTRVRTKPSFQPPKPIKFQGLTLCHEASPLSNKEYIPCLRPAVAIIDNGDRRFYHMCFYCADHNLQNRGARLVAIKDESEE